MCKFLFQSAVNFSEGRRPDVIAALIASADLADDVRVIDYSLDADHNRSVITLLGSGLGVETAVVNMSKIAIDKIDLCFHDGIHPRFGAVDVVPIVPLRDTPKYEAIQVATNIADRLAAECGIPVYFYEWSASPGHLTTLPSIRSALRNASAHSGDLLIPDVAPNHPAASAGVTIVGARPPLVAYNIDLATADLTIARKIAATIRSNRESVHMTYLHGVRAIGLYLESRGRAQVSMNLTEPESSPLIDIWNYVNHLAMESKTEAWESEVIGVIPAASMAGTSPEAILWKQFSPEKILDFWMD